MFGKVISNSGHFVSQRCVGEQSPVWEYLEGFKQQNVTIVQNTANEEHCANDGVNKHLEDVDNDEYHEHVPHNRVERGVECNDWER